MHLKVFTKCQMLCNAYDDMINFLITFLTSGMLQSFPLKEISSRDLKSAKSVGLSSGKGNVSNTLTFKLFIKQQELT